MKPEYKKKIKLRIQELATKKKPEVLLDEPEFEEPALPGFERFLPKPKKPAPQITVRRAISYLVADMAGATAPPETYRRIWHYLYRQLYWRCGINVQIRAARSGNSAITEVENAGLLDDLYKITCEVYITFKEQNEAAD